MSTLTFQLLNWPHHEVSVTPKIRFNPLKVTPQLRKTSLATRPRKSARAMRRIWRRARTESVHDYAGVLVPLDEAHLHSHSARCGRTEFEDAPDDAASDQGDAGKDRDDEGTGMLEMSAAEYSIEGLRKAVRSGERGKQWSEYESTKQWSLDRALLLMPWSPC